MDLLRLCNMCRFVKSAGDFYAGVASRCKECHKAAVKAARAKNPEHYKAFDRARASNPDRVAARAAYKNTDAGRAAHSRATSSYINSHPERRAAQVALGNAVRDGKVTPWPICAISECDRKPVAHHPNYDAPLDVVWLCQAHHKQAHALVREAA